MHSRKVVSVASLAVTASAAAIMFAVTVLGQSTQPAATQPQDIEAPSGTRITPEGWFAPQQKPNRPELPEIITRAFVIPIHGAITNTTYDVIRRKVLQCKGSGAEMVIFDMDTPGGAMDAMSKVVRLIIEDLEDVYTVAYVTHEAISAGSIISIACDEIVMTGTSRMGDAMPVMIGPQGFVPIPDKERGKIESYTRAEVRMLAKRNGYNVSLCEAMITITMELWLIRNRGTDELRIVDAAEWSGRVSGVPPGKMPTSAPVVMQEGEWVYLRTIDGPDELITPTADEAVFMGLAGHIFETIEELKKHYNIAAEPTTLGDNWSEQLVGFLTSPAVAGFLFFAAILCGYIEIKTAGFGIAGTIAIICLAILFGSRFLVGLAQWWEIALFALGLILLAVEILVIPDFGIVGILGIICCVVGLGAIFVSNPPDELPLPKTELDWSLLSDGVFALCVGLICAMASAAALTRYLPRLPLANQLILTPPTSATDFPVPDSSPMKHIVEGNVGIVESICRPVGKVRFGDDLLDAASEGEIIEVSANVRVLRREGNHLIVEEV